MAGAASSCADLSEIEGTIVVVEEIGRISLEAAQIVHDYAKPSIRGKASIAGTPLNLPLLLAFQSITQITARTVKHPLSDISSRIARCQKRCIELTEILDRRVHFDTNARVKGIQDVQMGSPSCQFLLLATGFIFHFTQREKSAYGWMPLTPLPTTTRHARNISQRQDLGSSTDLHSRDGRSTQILCSGFMVVVSDSHHKNCSQLKEGMYSWFGKDYPVVRIYNTLSHRGQL